MRADGVPFSVYGVPVIGLMSLMACLWHPQVEMPMVSSQDILVLVTPSPKLDKNMTIFLCQEAKDVAECRKHRSSSDVAQAVASYNLIAQECTPAVFRATHLPPKIGF